MESKKGKLEEKEDRISALPDSIIHHILSFLELTSEAIQTSVLSKRWEKQWTHVPVLIFDFSGMSSDDFSDDSSDSDSNFDVSSIIDNTLSRHECPKLKKFHIISWRNVKQDPNCNAKLRFAIRKKAEEVFLDFEWRERFKMPQFFFNHASFFKLRIINCILMPNGRVIWDCLKHLDIESCSLRNGAIESVISGSPLLESLEICNCKGFDRLVIASKTLKRLVLADINRKYVLEVSCPNLEIFYALAHDQFHILYDRAIENVLSGCPLLQSLELAECEGIRELVIASNSLKKLVLVGGTETKTIVISCPNLEELNLYFVCADDIKLTSLPSSVCATLDFNCREVSYGERLARMVLEQLHHVKELNLRRCCIKILSALEMRGLSCPSLSIKCLTFDGGSNFVKDLPGIAYVLRSSPQLEKLVINLQDYECRWIDDLEYLNVSDMNSWNINGTVFDCLVSHLKTVKIIGLSSHSDSEEDNNNNNSLKFVLNFVEFLLKNAQMLEKMVVTLEDCEADDVVFEVSQKLLSFPKSSQNSVVEFCCKSPKMSRYFYRH